MKHNHSVRFRLIVELAVTLIYAIIITLFFKTFLFDPFHVPSSSMNPTLIAGDRIFVSKYDYGYSRFSMPFRLAPIKSRILTLEKPKRGDIVVFVLPQKQDTFYVKRIIGLPGDVISITSNTPIVNGEKFKQKFIQQAVDEDGNKISPVLLEYEETNSDDRSYNIYKSAEANSKANVPAFTVPEGKYFMMGDNRDNSLDSRFETVGFIPYENLIGPAKAIFFSAPYPPIQAIFMPWSIRYSRMFESVEPKQNISVSLVNNPEDANEAKLEIMTGKVKLISEAL